MYKTPAFSLSRWYFRYAPRHPEMIGVSEMLTERFIDYRCSEKFRPSVHKPLTRLMSDTHDEHTWPPVGQRSELQVSFAQPHLQKHYCCTKFLTSSLCSVITVRFESVRSLCKSFPVLRSDKKKENQPDSRKSYCTNTTISKGLGGWAYWCISKFKIYIFNRLRRDGTFLFYNIKT